MDQRTNDFMLKWLVNDGYSSKLGSFIKLKYVKKAYTYIN